MNKCKDCNKEHENNNVGCRNSGNRNSGDLNSGNRNSGDLNSGHWNSGNWNSGNWNSGCFNTNSPDKIRIFNTWVVMTHEEFNEKYNTFADIPLNRWIGKENMTDEEKLNVEGWGQMGGYLKTLPFKEACKIWWAENPDRHDDFLNLPNFDSKVFEEITGIDVKSKDDMVDIDGKKWSKETIKDALKKHLNFE